MKHTQTDRRSFLKVGMLGSLGLGLDGLLRGQAQAQAAGREVSREASVIVLHMRGGPSQLDMWDMKPNAPDNIRGEFQPIATGVPGISICELLPHSARIMDHWSIVRSLHHRPEDGDVSHSRGDQVVFTGYSPGANPDTNIHPSFGSVVAKQSQHEQRPLPAYVMVPRMIPGTDAAYLGQACRPFETMADPASGGEFRVPNLAPPEGMDGGQLADRRQLLRQFDGLRRDLDQTGRLAAMDAFQRQAWDILTSPQARDAFNLDAEPTKVRDRYGYAKPYQARMRAGGDRPPWNQRLLLARRLVEAGVRLVTVDLRWWDTHDDNFWSLRNGFLEPFDQAYSALIEDLHERGLLESTLVLAWGEHGRTPRINNTAGRDHWMSAFSAALAGGGVVGGRVVGSTDAHAARPRSDAKIPHDVLATLYRHLSIDTTAQYLDHTGRPHPVLPFGKPIDELF